MEDHRTIHRAGFSHRWASRRIRPSGIDNNRDCAIVDRSHSDALYWLGLYEGELRSRRERLIREWRRFILPGCVNASARRRKSLIRPRRWRPLATLSPGSGNAARATRVRSTNLGLFALRLIGFTPAATLPSRG